MHKNYRVEERSGEEEEEEEDYVENWTDVLG